MHDNFSGINMAQNTTSEKTEETKRKVYKFAEFKLDSPIPLRYLASGIELVSEEPWFKFTQEGIEVREMDPSHVALVHAILPKNMFDKYEMQLRPMEFEICFKLEDFQNALKRAYDKEPLSVVVDTHKEPEITITSMGERKKVFSIYEIEGTHTTWPMPKISFDTKFSIARKALQNILDDVASVSDEVLISTNNKSIVFSGAERVEITLERNDKDILEFSCKENSVSKYKIDYLQSALKAIPVDAVLVEYSKKMPIRLFFRLSEYGGSLWYYLAPRIEES
jgi:proliferating cell nuclear antigen